MNTPSFHFLSPAASSLRWRWRGSSPRMKREDEGTERMREIAAHVRKGAMAYLRQQYKVVLVVSSSWRSSSPTWPTARACRTCGSFAFPTAASSRPGWLLRHEDHDGALGSARPTPQSRRRPRPEGRFLRKAGAVMGPRGRGPRLLDISFWYLILTVSLTWPGRRSSSSSRRRC